MLTIILVQLTICGGREEEVTTCQLPGWGVRSSCVQIIVRFHPIVTYRFHDDRAISMHVLSSLSGSV